MRSQGLDGKKVTEKQYWVVVTLDMQNAFNSARWDRIMEALDQFGIPNYLQKLIASYFIDRILQYDTDDGLKVYHWRSAARLDTGAAFMDHHVQRPTQADDPKNGNNCR